MWYTLSAKNRFGFDTHQVALHPLYELLLHETGRGHLVEFIEKRMILSNKVHFSFTSAESLPEVVDVSLDRAYNIIRAKLGINEARWAETRELLINRARVLTTKDTDPRFSRIQEIAAELSETQKSIILYMMYKVSLSDLHLHEREQAFILGVARLLNSEIQSMDDVEVSSSFLDYMGSKPLLGTAAYSSEQLELVAEILYLTTMADGQMIDSEVIAVSNYLSELGISVKQARKSFQNVALKYGQL